ncbi:MAG: sugar nucleotide-binding protein, partial [Chloroflexi bacterium]|nr:sugar nucleotide-binding protein [Chloroflexota bacterium]
IEKCIERDLTGIYNCACRDSWTKYAFGRNIAEVFGLNPALVFPASLDDVGLNAKRGKDLRLNVTRLETALGEPLSTMSESLDRLHQDWQKGFPREIKKYTGEQISIG